MTPAQIAVSAEALRNSLVEQASDAIDMGDYKKQIRVYQIMLRDLIVLVRDLAKSVDTALIPPTEHLPLD